MDFDKAFARLLGHEGGYSDHKADGGGRTMWGVTEAVARENGYTGSMRDLPQDFAKAVYRAKYWDAVQADHLPMEIRFDVFDAAVHSHPKQAIKWLQRAANVEDDGIIGPQTLMAVKADNPWRLFAHFNGHRLLFLTERKNWRDFATGWSRRIASNLMGLK